MEVNVPNPPDNFIPDSIDKRNGTISIAESGEVTATFTNSNSKKVNFCYPGSLFQFI